MQKISKVLNAAIVVSPNGKKLGTVKDVILDGLAHTILAFLVRDAGLLGPAMVVPFGSVQSISPYGVLVESPKAIVKASSDTSLKLAVQDKNKIKGKSILDRKGGSMGKVADLSFDPSTGRIVEIETEKGVKGQGTVLEPAAIPADEVVQVDQKAVRVERTGSEPVKNTVTEDDSAEETMLYRMGDTGTNGPKR